MKIWKYFKTIALAAALMATANLFAEEIPAAESPNTASNKVLVVYFSMSGNTREVAEWIEEATGGDLVELELVTPYPDNYGKVLEQVRKEHNEGTKPELKTKIEEMDKYGTVFVGTPNWLGTMAPPVLSFFSTHDLSGKTVVPFITHGSGGAEKCVSAMKDNAAKSVFLEPMVIRDRNVPESKDAVFEWAKRAAAGKK